MKDMDRLHLDIDLFRQQNDRKHVLVCYSIDYHSEQRHLLRSEGCSVSPESIKECVTKILSRCIEGSVFNDADPPRTLEAIPYCAQESLPERV